MIPQKSNKNLIDSKLVKIFEGIAYVKYFAISQICRAYFLKCLIWLLSSDSDDIFRRDENGA